MKIINPFWEKTIKEHELSLNTHGFENFKRYLNDNYFNWSWEWKFFFRKQMRFLLAHTSPVTWLRALREIGKRERWGRSDSRLFKFATRLVWEYARKHDALGIMKFEEPSLGNPLPVTYNGRIISQDLANTSLELNWAITEKPNKVLELGAGYGRNAYAMLKLYPNIEYTIADIEPTISISKKYLTTLFPNAQLKFISPLELSKIPDNYTDFTFSISTLPEFTDEATKFYLKQFDRISGKMIYLKQWTKYFTYNFFSNLVKKEVCPIQTNFTQALWKQK